MRMKAVSIVCSLFLLVGALPVWAAPITSLFNTGVDDNGQLLPPGPDLHYTISRIDYAGPYPQVPYDPQNPPTVLSNYLTPVPPMAANILQFTHGAWVPNGPTSNWVSYEGSFGSSQFFTGLYTYQTTFDLTGLDPNSVQISGVWGTDDPGWMYLNLSDTNVPDINNLVVFGGGFSSLTQFSITGTNGLFRPGLNTLTFVVWDAGNAVTGLRLDIQSATAEPGQCVQPTTGVAHWWPGDDNAHDIVNGNDGTLVNGATFAQGKVGPAFSFSSAGDMVTVPDNPSLNLESLPASSFEGWFKSNGGSDYGDALIIAKHTCSVATGWFFTTDQGCFIGDSYVGGYGVGNLDLDDGQFHHFACVKDGSLYREYIDGILTGESTGSITGTPTTEPVMIGSITTGSCYPMNHQLFGVTDELTLYKSALTEDEVRAIYLTGAAGKCRELAVTIDITPGGFPNSINPAGRGVVPVAVLTTPTFNAALVAAPTVRFGATGTEAAPVHFALEDVDLDGDLDLILQFTTLQTGIICGITSATLTGMTIDGVAITGTDSVNTVGCR